MSFIRAMGQKIRSWLDGGEEKVQMDRSSSERKEIKNRQRRVVERLMENSSLRDELTDDQAQRLLDWGNDHLKKVAAETAGLGDEDADNILEAQTERVSGVMRQVNRVVETVNRGERQEAEDHLKALLENLDSLQNKTVESEADVEQLVAAPEIDNQQLFEKLMALIDDGEEE
jgi:hypothetical protein